MQAQLDMATQNQEFSDLESESGEPEFETLYLIDFDDTLFNTEKLKRLTAAFFRDAFGIDLADEDFQEDYSKVKEQSGGIYSIIAHLRSHGITESTEDITEKFQSYFQNHDLLFEYTERYLKLLKNRPNGEVVIFTYGEEQNQHLKMSLYKNIFDEHQVMVVVVPKNEVFESDLELSSDDKYRLKGLSGNFKNVVYVDDKVHPNLKSKGNFTVFQIEVGGMHKVIQIICPDIEA